jgi:hypothetical protein
MKQNTEGVCEQGCRAEHLYLKGRQYQDDGKNCIMRGFIVRILHRDICVIRLVKSGRGGRAD